MILLFYGEGRLGNQVFQYQALNSLGGRDARIFAIGLEEIGRVAELEGAKVRILSGNPWIKRLIKYVISPVVLRPLARYLRIIGYAHEPLSGIPPNVGSSGEMSYEPGLLRNVVFVDGGYYQNSRYWPEIFPSSLLRIREEVRSRARYYVDMASMGGRRRVAFVHVRRGDYLSFSSYGLTDLVLPESYYRSAIRVLKERFGSLYLLFVTDDVQWVSERFADIPEKSVVSTDEATDFAIMAGCTAGVLSNSTYSLAAALMMANVELVIGPRYWFGFKVGRWFPPGIEFSHPRLMYLAVSEAAA